jgi:hypothetical protein
MKVHIGPYKRWWGPFHVADLLRYLGFPEELRERIGRRLNETRLLELCQWIHDRRKRKIVVRIDDYDVWNMDHTLGMIVVPMLKLLKERKQGAPHVDDEDVPERLRSTNAPALTEEEINTGSPDANWFPRWDWVLDEIIWSFEQIVDEEGSSFSNNEERIQNGMLLFGKYLRGMWD